MPRNATIGFSTTNKLASKAIRWVTGSPVSHAWIAFDDEQQGKRVVLQAEARCVELKPWDEWIQENILKAEFNLIGPNPGESVDWAVHNFVGQPYDWINAGLAGLWRWFGAWINARGSNPRRLLCSEIVIRTLCHAKYTSLDHFNPEVTDPFRLLKRVLEMSLRYHEQFEVKSIHNDMMNLAANCFPNLKNKGR